ncbi:MAG: tetratricopeptide repeat protein [Verrucomicrobia bacterium]|nr:tetratricopeptide repeat protein [Verrucomicrobiota bacterium]
MSIRLEVSMLSSVGIARKQCVPVHSARRDCDARPPFRTLAFLVAQTCSLPYRRFAIGSASASSRALGLAARLQDAILRYGRLQICATLNQWCRAGRSWSRLALTLLPGLLAQADELSDAQKLFLKGDYAECIRSASEAMKERFTREEWPILFTRAQLQLGRYREALGIVTNALTRHSRSIPVRLLAREVFLQNGRTEDARDMLQEINELAGARRLNYPDAASFVALGKAALLLGADARLVLENFFNQAKKADPEYRDTYLAIGQLALEKYDYDLASKTFHEGLKKFRSDPDLFYGLAKAFSTGERTNLVENLDKALQHNPRHTPSLLLVADHQIDAEDYAEAEKTLEKVLAVNPVHPEAWAYRAVLAHLRSDPEGETKARETALKYWKTNPRVPYLIGQKLSQKYRFTEGSAYQRQAATWDAEYVPSKIQLAQDLLRLGKDEEGWRLAEEVHKKDAYDVVAYNLVTLRETLANFRFLTNQDFAIRMAPHEAETYGNQVVELLGQAKAALSQKYEFETPKPTMVEIFPEQKDFAVRTFMMPGGEGYLGVCFGNVITANSPASQTASPSNWKAMLWHEFCHVVTLGLTKNKMPRWLSEGISVYEETRAHATWGQTMIPRYREMIMKGELTPVRDLSAAFLTPKTSFHLQFAYYQSSLVVEFLVERFGFDALKGILKDLGEGKEINAAIEARTAAMPKIETEFEAFARRKAEELGPDLEWKRPEGQPGRARGEAALDLIPHNGDDQWMEKHPRNYWVLQLKAKRLIQQKKWEDAKAPLKTLIENYPDQVGQDSAYLLLASAHRGLNETDLERQALSRVAALDADAIDAFLRLMELASATGDWSEVAANAERFLAVNPLVPGPYRYLGRAHEELGRPQKAIEAYQILLKLDPPDPADVHFRLAKMLHTAGDHSAKRHLLKALEEAPRFLEAHKFLLAITQEKPAASPPPADAPPAKANP